MGTRQEDKRGELKIIDDRGFDARGGMTNVFTETLLYAMAYNINKFCNKKKRNLYGVTLHKLKLNLNTRYIQRFHIHGRYCGVVGIVSKHKLQVAANRSNIF